MKFNVRTKAYERVMTEETLRKLRETRRANQADLTLSFTENTGNRFTISQAALEELTLDVNSASFDVVEGDGAYLLVLEGNQGIFFKGNKVKENGKKSKTITYDKLVEDLQELGQVPAMADVIAGKTKAHFDLVKVEEEIESEDESFKILSAWKLVISTKAKAAESEDDEVSDADGVEEEVTGEDTATPTDDEGFGA